jgi:hypothetical protein
MVALHPNPHGRKAVIDLINLIENFYPVAVQEFREVKSNLFVFQDKRSKRKYIFKLHDPLCKPNLTVLARIYELTGKHGFAPLNVPTTAGAQLADSENLIFSLHEFLSPAKNDNQYEPLLSRRLAGLHLLLSSTRFAPIVNHFKRVVPDMAYAAGHYRFIALIPLIQDTQERLQKLPRQVIHGDLHPANIVQNSGKVYFIDFDSATCSATGIDVAFSAFRCLGSNPEKIKRFVAGYNRSDPPYRVVEDDIWLFLAYSFLERILFILIERDNGHGQWLPDLHNQQRFLNTACGLLNIEAPRHKCWGLQVSQPFNGQR